MQLIYIFFLLPDIIFSGNPFDLQSRESAQRFFMNMHTLCSLWLDASPDKKEKEMLLFLINGKCILESHFVNFPYFFAEFRPLLLYAL